jgi:hypothetical protein
MKAYELLEKADWTQGAFARDSKGVYVDLYSEEAVSFCSVGAIGRANCGEAYPHHKVVALCNLLEVNLLTKWNDDPDRTKEEVIAALRGADL